MFSELRIQVARRDNGAPFAFNTAEFHVTAKERFAGSSLALGTGRSLPDHGPAQSVSPR